MSIWAVGRRCHPASTQPSTQCPSRRNTRAIRLKLATRCRKSATAPSTVAYAAHNRRMLDAVVNSYPLPDFLAVLGSAGSVTGGGIGLIVNRTTLRQALENLTLGAAAGGTCGCFAAFLAYFVICMLD